MEGKKRIALISLILIYLLLVIAIIRALIGEIYFYRAKGMEKAGFWLKAIPLYEKALYFDPNRVDLYERLARLYFLRALFPADNDKERDRMVGILLKGTSICPYDAQLYLGIGLFYEATDRDQEAKLYYNKAISLDPNNAFYHTVLSAFYLKRGQKIKGIREAQKAASCSNANMVIRCLRRMGISITKNLLFNDIQGS